MAIAQKITELAALTEVDADDVLPIVDDPAGGAATKKIKASAINKSFIRTAEEIAAPVTPVDFRLMPSPIRDLSRYVSDNTGATDVAAEFQAAVDLNKNDLIIPDGVYLHNTKITVTKSDTALFWAPFATLKAGAVMTSQIEIGDGVNRKEGIQLINPRLNGDNLASFGITDLGVRLSSIFDGYFQNMIEYCILQQPTTTDFSEFMDVIRCQGFDGKGFYKHLATATSRATDTTFIRNIHFRAAEWMHVWDTAQRFTSYKDMIGSQTATYLGGIDIRCNDVLIADTVTAEHDIVGLYVESNPTLAPPIFTGSHTGSSGAAILTDSGAAFTAADIGRTLNNIADGSSTIVTAFTSTTLTGVLSGGTDNDWDNGDTYDLLGIIAVQLSNNSSAKTVGGCDISKIKTQPANEVLICNLRPPTTASTLRDTDIGGIDTNASFVGAITIGSGVVKTQIGQDGFQGSTAGKIVDRSSDKAVVNNLLERSFGIGGTPNVGDPGRKILNSADNSSWIMDNAGVFHRLGGTVTATTTELLDITDPINTSPTKVDGFMVFNTTTSTPVWAAGNLDANGWNDVAGVLQHAPV